MSDQIMCHVLAVLIFLIAGMSIFTCGEESGIEISSQMDVISCRYHGLVERNGELMVKLTFIKHILKNINQTWASGKPKDVNTTAKIKKFILGKINQRGDI